jgi:polyhydroxyalkanoate synthesis regulator phasin
VTQLVQAGTINDAQARVLDADIHTGRIDPDQLVANRTLTTAQAQAVMDRLGAVKRSMAPPAQQSSAVKPGDASPGDAAPAESDAPFLAAVTQMVQAGTINDAQARVLDADIHTGRIDPDQLVANGTLTTAQSQAVMDRLGAVKRSLAPAAQQSRVAKPADRKGSHG